MAQMNTSTSEVLVLVLGLVCVGLHITLAQNPCDDLSSNMTVRFNESDQDPDPSDPRFVRTILNGQPYSLTITSNTGSSRPDLFEFDEKFRSNYDSNTDRTYVQMIGAIDRDGVTAGVQDDVVELQYQVECQGFLGSSIRYGVLRIIIMDVNDNPPVFLQIPYETVVAENVPPGITIFRVSSRDSDSYMNNQPYYFLHSFSAATFNGTGVFEIDPNTGDVYTIASVDFDSMYDLVRSASMIRYDLIVKAVDGGIPRLTSTAALTIYVVDTNDQRPAFSYPSCLVGPDYACVQAEYDSYITSNQTEGSVLTLVPVPAASDTDETVDILAYDRDTLNASISCSIYAANPTEFYTDYFQVTTSRVGTTNLYNCTIRHRPNKPIFWTAHQFIQLTLEARETDNDVMAVYATVNIEVLGVTGSPPVFTTEPPSTSSGQSSLISPINGIAYVIENSDVGVAVSATRNMMRNFEFTFHAASSDQNDLEISTLPSSAPFFVTNDGHILVARLTIDFESRSTHELKVIVASELPSRRTSTATVHIFVLDLNDNSPQFAVGPSYMVDLEEGDFSTSAPEVIYKLIATDSDGSSDNNVVTFAVESVSPPGGLQKFRLNPSSGELFVQGSVSAGETYNIRVSATDNGLLPLKSETTVVVNITGKSSDDGLSTGVLVGIAVAGGLILCLVLILVTCCYCKRKRRGARGANQNAGKARGGDKELGVHNVAFSPHLKDQSSYAYADGFIHKDSSSGSGFDYLGLRRENEEIYDRINEEAVVDNADNGNNTAQQQPNAVIDDAYAQPTDDDSSNATPALSASGNSDNHSPAQPKINVSNGHSPMLPKRNNSVVSSTYYSPDDEISVGPEQNSTPSSNPQAMRTDQLAKEYSTEDGYLNPSSSLPKASTDSTNETSYYHDLIDTVDDRSDLYSSDSNEDATEFKVGSSSPEEDGRSGIQNKAGDKNQDSKTYYDTLVADDPNYSNLNRDPRQYFRINVDDKTSM